MIDIIIRIPETQIECSGMSCENCALNEVEGLGMYECNNLRKRLIKRRDLSGPCYASLSYVFNPYTNSYTTRTKVEITPIISVEQIEKLEKKVADLEARLKTIEDTPLVKPSLSSLHLEVPSIDVHGNIVWHNSAEKIPKPKVVKDIPSEESYLETCADGSLVFHVSVGSGFIKPVPQKEVLVIFAEDGDIRKIPEDQITSPIKGNHADYIFYDDMIEDK